MEVEQHFKKPAFIDDDDRSEGPMDALIPGMESVVATVSGYHGRERFKLINLISSTGASYVGSMGRFITHLVCWRFEGRKYDLSRAFGTIVVSHRWFEECLKAGKRVSEGPYIMRSGQDSGSISCKLPHVLDSCTKRKSLLNRERDALADLSNISNCDGAVKINEDSSNIKGSEKVIKMRKTSKKNLRSGNKDHIGLSANGPDHSSSLATCLSPSATSHRFDTFDNDVSQSARRSRRLVKKHASYVMDCSTLDRKQKNHMAESSDRTEGTKSESELVNFRNSLSMNASAPHLLASRDMPLDCNVSRIEGLEEDEDRENINMHTLIRESSCSRNCDSFSTHGTSHIKPCTHVVDGIYSCDFCVKQNTKMKIANDLGESAGECAQTEVSCAICWTDFCSERGVLNCGHRFCYSCIHEWADCMVSKGKVSTCPLCKTSFSSITKYKESGSLDQKIFSQTIPCSSNMDILILRDSAQDTAGIQPSDSICYECHNQEPVDLLINCHLCQRLWVHTYCLDPPLIPWTCINCRDLRMLYQRFR